MSNLTLLSQLVQILPHDVFNRIVKRLQTDKHCKGLNSWTHLISMLFCHLGHANSVRDISNGLRSITGNLNHLGIKRAPCKSSLSYMNAHRDWKLFKEFYFELLTRLEGQFKGIRKGLPRLKRKIFLMDATVIPLCLSMFNWAKFRSKKGGVKLHLVLDYDGCLPVFAELTKARKHEVKIAQKLRFPAESVVVFDMGYIDYAWMNNLDSSKVFFVTRLKNNADYSIVTNHEIDTEKDPDMLQDAQIQLEGFYASQDYPGQLRMVRILDSIKGEEYTFLTNNFDWTARTVADIYQERWDIEIFFKQIKQHLRIKSFIGTSQNAVQIQVWSALITMLLLQYLKAKAQYGWHLSNLATFIRLNLFVKIALMEWLNKPFFSNREFGTQQISIFTG
jgi:hypothetical protein